MPSLGQDMSLMDAQVMETVWSHRQHFTNVVRRSLKQRYEHATATDGEHLGREEHGALLNPG